MDDGKPSGPKAKWWSRPSAERVRPAEPEGPAPGAEAGTGAAPADAVTASGSGGDDSFTLAPPVPGPGASVTGTGARPFTDAPSTGAADRTETETEPGPVPAVPPSADAPPSEPADAPPHARAVLAGAPVPEASGDGPVAPGVGAPGPSGPGAPSAPGEPVASAPRAPLHTPDEYSTPPYGGPGPWAPAPPVQRPVPTPAHGTPVPPPYAGGGGHGPAAPAPGDHVPGEAYQAPGESYPPPGGAYGPPPPGSPHTLPHQHQHQHPHPHQAAMTEAQQPPPADLRTPPPPLPQTGQWTRYDPWGAPQQPLSRPDTGAEGGKARKGRRGAALAGAVLLALVAGGIGGGIGSYIERNGGLTTVELPQAGPDSGGRAPDSVAGIAARALPGVVTLHVSGSAESGTGTGFVLDGKGHILTNNHVVAPAGSAGHITVTFSGGETASAEIVGKDSGYDLAVVKVRGVSGLKPLALGNSDNVRVGDPVVAIGAPFDLSNTVTSGIISAKQRPITAGGEKGDGSDVSYVDALQTDAPINPGNSGGPLVDTQARVIGINSAIRAADSGSGLDGGQSGSIGLGFAIPVNQAKRVAEELINTGKATHPVIGVTLDMQYTGDGAKVGGKSAEGTSAVTPGGPADKAGIRAGDVITQVQGQRVHSGEELIIKIRAHRPGDRLDLRLTRGGKELPMTVTLGSASGS
ncbi:trypsin-like peptidase domain-containing protein [Streptomyces sp. SM18]|uniref:trypsin-like peptidase domain-containing protein n=2 Tax=unclassified Streptomyces TaxID=2593676 RepID=UPI000D669558|nr:trypsin-like peptidase domain-containing protein [Streptomyces sp. SM18]AWL40434.1 protease [Streptomyces sp. SM18]